ncbi:PilW family protein [Aliivibrio kagoshimensis]|uniref:PilW family protein n=1 Tax=Aliivibrio kagoshimensis TaxID=2910230 RepID=UPI003D13D3CB
MAIVAVKGRHPLQQGMTLLEVLVSAAITLITVMSVVSLHVAGTRLLIKQQQQLRLTQGLNDAMQLLSAELLRAGYSSSALPYRLAGSEQVIAAAPSSSTPSLSFLYQQSLQQWQVTTFRYKPSVDILQYCYKPVAFSEGDLPTMDAEWVCDAGAVRSLVDQSVIKIRDFYFRQTEFERKRGRFLTLEISITGELTAAPQWRKTVRNQLTIRNSY